MKDDDVVFPIELVDAIATYLAARPYGEVAMLFDRMSDCIKQQFNNGHRNQNPEKG